MTRGNQPASCDRRVNRVVHEEGQGSHRARRATQQRESQPEWMVLELTERNYGSSHVVSCYTRESVTTGGDPRMSDQCEERVKEEVVRCQLRCGSMVPADLRVGSGRGKARKRPRSMNAEDGARVTMFRMPTVPTLQPRRECNAREQGHQGNYFTNSSKIATGR